MSTMTELICLSRESSAATLALTPIPAKKVAASAIPTKSAAKSFQFRNTCLIGYSSGVYYLPLDVSVSGSAFKSTH
jgi:hypothetical protein